MNIINGRNFDRNRVIIIRNNKQINNNVFR